MIASSPLRAISTRARSARLSRTARYNGRSYTLDWEHQTVRMSLVGGRQTVRFNIPEYSTNYAGNPIDTADLLFRQGRWWLHVVVTVAAPETRPTDQVVGVDLGVVRPAVTSNNQFLGERRWKATEGELFHLKRKLQKKGTKSAKRHLKRLGGKQARFRRNNDHILSRQIVGSTEAGATIAVEKPDQYPQAGEGQTPNPNPAPCSRLVVCST